ncbi:unnamed protein product [Adineta steineri]|uniref:NHL repeat containing protein-like protein n=1 Tax=Adineta steineri TaxID=433720 RepID=A0A814WA28_9BILA|nr:unnamed protein product [Adineta steineri]CAF3968398.1 unnamed protein product [Adineta steineri]
MPTATSTVTITTLRETATSETTSTASTITTTTTTKTSSTTTISTTTTTSSTTTSTTATTTTSTSTTTTTTTTTTSTTTTTTDTTTTTSTTTTSTSTATTSTTTTTTSSTSTTITTTTTTITTSTSTTTSSTSTTTAGNPCISGGYRWNTTGVTILNSTQMTCLNDLFFDLNDTLYIVDETSNSVIWKLPKNAVNPILVAGQVLSTGPNSTQLSSPQSAYLDSKQNLYVTDYYNYRVQKYINGSRIGMTIAGISGTAGTASNVLGGPRFLCLDSTETYMYIADGDNNRIIRFKSNSTSGTNRTVVAGGNEAGNGNTQLNYPWGVYCPSSISSYLYITNANGHSVMQWAPGNTSGIVIAGTPGVAGSNATLLKNPAGIKIDTYLNMFVVDQGNNRVQLYCYNNQTATTIAGNGTAGAGAEQFNNPRGIAFDSSMNMYIADYYNQRIQKFLKL